MCFQKKILPHYATNWDQVGFCQQVSLRRWFNCIGNLCIDRAATIQTCHVTKTFSNFRFPFTTVRRAPSEECIRPGRRIIDCSTSKRTLTGRLTSGSRPGQAVPSQFCQRSKDKGKLRPKFIKCEKINIFEHATGFRPPVAMAKPKWRQILLSLTLFSNVTSKEGKPMSCTCSVFILVNRMSVCNFSPMG